MSFIGILALQGDFNKHAQIVEKLGYNPKLVKDEKALVMCDRLIIPGGESTTILKLIDRLNLRKALKTFGKEKPIFGTCAGLIILANHVENDNLETLELINIQVARNAYGRQIDSFIDTIDLNLNGRDNIFEAIFIRAPKILHCSEGVTPLAFHKGSIVMAASKNILVATFHPELTNDLRIHDFFLNHFA